MNTSAHKKLALLIDHRNGIHKVKRFKLIPDCKDFLGVQYGAYKGHIGNKRVPAKSISDICSSVNRYVEDIRKDPSYSNMALNIEPLSPRDFDDDVDVYEFAKKHADVDRRLCQQIIDERVNKNEPLFRAFQYPEEYADGLFKMYGGLHYIYRVSKSTNNILRGTVHVRYVSERAHSFVLRFKMHIPHSDGAPEYYQYYGNISDLSGNLYWVAEEISIPRSDMIFVMTDQGHFVNGGKVMSGLYSTFSQESPPRAIATRVCIEQQTKYPDNDDEIGDFMSNGPHVFEHADELDPHIEAELFPEPTE